MTKNYSKLPTVVFNAGSAYVHSGELPEITHLDDPALDIIVDFKINKAITVKRDTPITLAGLEMKACNVHMLLVTDENDAVIGLVTSADLLGEKPVQAAQEKFIARADVKVGMVLTPADKIIAIDYNELRIAKVGHIIQTLNNAKQHYALVVEIDPASKAQTLRGIISLLQISRQLDKNVIKNDPLAGSIVELSKKIDG